MYDPNESSAVHLLTSDDKYAVCGMDFSLNQLLCQKYLVEETFDHLPGNEKEQLSAMGLGDLRHRRTMILKVYINGHESRGKPRKGTQQVVNEFHKLAAKNLNVNAVQRSIASVI